MLNYIPSRRINRHISIKPISKLVIKDTKAYSQIWWYGHGQYIDTCYPIELGDAWPTESKKLLSFTAQYGKFAINKVLVVLECFKLVESTFTISAKGKKGGYRLPELRKDYRSKEYKMLVDSGGQTLYDTEDLGQGDGTRKIVTFLDYSAEDKSINLAPGKLDCAGKYLMRRNLKIVRRIYLRPRNYVSHARSPGNMPSFSNVLSLQGTPESVQKAKIHVGPMLAGYEPEVSDTGIAVSKEMSFYVNFYYYVTFAGRYADAE